MPTLITKAIATVCFIIRKNKYTKNRLKALNKLTLEAHSVRKCASAIFVQSTSDISLMRYAATRAIYGFAARKGMNIISQKSKDFYIAFTVR